eukprot:TRINITY_DN44248_c0_g1_i1.p2 TRINITY_DN44248_c0_g1~~TRINITY_DN44248_c0_g1_i1.p2  ORF type:complete len:109 (+),score=16.47 TRINITY_DN44248_c0_g1_i1:52-378(+)
MGHLVLRHRVCVTCLAVLIQVPATFALTREYFVRAEEVLWDYGPDGLDRMTGQRFEGHADAARFMVNDPAAGQIGSKYWKSVFREYTDGSFSTQKARAKQRFSQIAVL